MSGIPLTVSTNGIGGGDGAVVQADPAQSPGSLNSFNGTSPNTGNSTSTSTSSNSTMNSTSTSTTPSPQYDDVEGSGDDDDDDGDNRDDLSSLLSLGSLITRAALFRRSIRSVEPIHSERKGRQFYSTCNDRITLPCIIEDFISVGTGSIPTCSPIHCGNSLCSSNVAPCRVESTVTPFAIGIHFGDGLNKGLAEDNIGACIRYKQLNCI